MINLNLEYGNFGGKFIAETLYVPLEELTASFIRYKNDPDFVKEYRSLLKNFVGRETPLYHLKRSSEVLGGAQIFIKREDLAHTGAHKINNSLGQALLAKKMGKKRIIAETGAGQHGYATASACALLGLDCTVYMGAIDMERQKTNVEKMRILGAKVVPVHDGQKTLKDAVNEALRDWVTNPDSAYIIGSALGPAPYPQMVRHFQSIIGKEAREQILEITGKLPLKAIACVGGGSNAIGLFSAFLKDDVELIGVEAGGKAIKEGQHAARFQTGKIGVYQGTKTYLLQDKNGQTLHTTSISAGLDYPAVGPEHSDLFEQGRVKYTYATDQETLEAFQFMARTEGILPALESSHALAYGFKLAKNLPKSEVILINLSGRGEKDLHTVINALEGKLQ